MSLLALLLAVQPGAGGIPLASVDLATDSGAGSCAAEWWFAPARVVDVDFPRAGPDRRPSGVPGRSHRFDPAAGAADADGTAWEAVPPESLQQRRGDGLVCFGWYRLELTVPERLGGVELRGTTAVFEVVVDDYAEVWVDGRLPRTIGQQGGSLIAGWNAANRLVVGRGVVPGQRISLAVFAANGPLSDPPRNYLWVRRALLDFVAADAAGPLPRIERLDPRIDEVIPRGAEVETVAAGFAWVEGPAWDAADASLLFTDIPRNRIWRWREQRGETVFLQPSGYTGSAAFTGREPGANGLAFTPDGRLLICQHGDRRLVRREPDGTLTTLADRYGGRRLNSPNDLAVAKDGTIYFTDPPYGLPGRFADPGRELAFSGVYRLGTDGTLTLLIDDRRGPNGVALSPDERTLFLSDADDGHACWLAYPLAADGVGEPRLLLDRAAIPGDLPGAPDGFAVAASGYLFAAGPGGVQVLAPDGTRLGAVVTGVATSNCCLDDAGRNLYITADHAVLRVVLRPRSQ